MSRVPLALLIDSFAALGALFALWKGGRAERAAAVIVIANIVIGQATAAVRSEIAAAICQGWVPPAPG